LDDVHFLFNKREKRKETNLEKIMNVKESQLRIKQENSSLLLDLYLRQK